MTSRLTGIVRLGKDTSCLVRTGRPSTFSLNLKTCCQSVVSTKISKVILFNLVISAKAFL